jgi:hypothetical protein
VNRVRIDAAGVDSDPVLVCRAAIATERSAASFASGEEFAQAREKAFETSRRPHGGGSALVMASVIPPRCGVISSTRAGTVVLAI